MGNLVCFRGKRGQSVAQQEAAAPEAPLAIQKAAVTVIGTDAPGEMTLLCFYWYRCCFLLEVWLQPSKTKKHKPNKGLVPRAYNEHL